MKEIPLSRGAIAIVDDGDYEELAKHKWYANGNGRGASYAARDTTLPDGTRPTILMHRVIIDAQMGQQVDHIDGDGLNNTRSNLRICTHQQNIFNQTGTKDGNKYKGVRWHKQHKCWRARIMLDRKETHLGYFKSPEEAAHAYDIAARRLHGEFARLNFPSLEIGRATQ